MNIKQLIYTFFIVLLFTVLLVTGCSKSNTSGIPEDLSGKQKVQNDNNSEEETDMNHLDDNLSEDNEKDATQSSFKSLEVDDYVRSDDQGDVIVDAVWSTYELYIATDNKDLIKEYEIDKYHVFDLLLTTHSGDLRTYSYMDNASLIIDGLKIQPAYIDVISSDSHHPRILLKFPKLNQGGKEYISKDSTLELLLKDLRDIPERRFVWDLPFE